MNRKVKVLSWALAFFIAYIAAMLFLLPARYILSFATLPPEVRLYSTAGTLWNGETIVFFKPSAGRRPVPFEGKWRFCLSSQFPFYAACVGLKHTAAEINAKIVGLPRTVLRLAELRMRADMEKAGRLMLTGTESVFVKPAGNIVLNMNELKLNLAERRLLSWGGELDLFGGTLFGIPLPDTRATMTNEPFISRDPTRGDGFADKKLPTIRFAGGNDKMTLSGRGQFLEDGQVKSRIEAAVPDASLHQFLQPFATGREGNKFVIDWQGDPLFFRFSPKKENTP